MQDNNVEASTSISQLLRESYLEESRIHQRHSEVSRSEATSHEPYYGTITGKSEEQVGQEEFQDLSAFLSQEELDKSVNLARQAITHSPTEEKKEGQALGNNPTTEVSNPYKATPNKQLPPSTAMTPEIQTFPSFRHDNVIKSTKGSRESLQGPRKQVINSPYGTECHNKKEFLNKAADFIEELSSLFKANSSKRIRPKACKGHRSRYQVKSQLESSVYPYTTNDRERPVVAIDDQLDSEEETYSEEPETFQQDNQEEEQEQEEEQQEESTETGATESSSPELASESFPTEEPIGEPPRFTQKLKSREVPEGSKVQLDCIVTGIPAPEVRWFCEGKELENSPDIQILNTGDLHSLIIAEAFEEDTGRYSCFASNFYGTDSTSAEIYIEGASSSESEGEPNFDNIAPIQENTSVSLTVSSPPPSAEVVHQDVSPVCSTPVQSLSHQLPTQQSQSPPNSYLQGLDGRPIMAAPVFTKMLQDLTAFEGQLVVLECRVKGSPSPKLDWYREGSLIEDSPDFRILQKKPRSVAEPEEICTLVIAEAFPEDSGTFTCTASNKYATVSSIAYLKVKGNQNRNNNHLNAISNIALEPSHPKAQAPLPEVIPPEPCLKPKLEGVLVNHKEPRPSSKLGLRVHFKLPDDKERETSSKENDVVLRHSLGNENSSYVASNAAGTITVESSLLKAPAFLPEATPPDPPGCLKPKLEGVLVNHNEPRSSSKAGLRVHFKLPEDNKEVASSEEGVLFAKQQKAVSPFDLVNGQSAGAAVPTAPVKEPPPVLAKPKLKNGILLCTGANQTKTGHCDWGRSETPTKANGSDLVQLQVLHNQVLLEQQQEGVPTHQPEPTSQSTPSTTEPPYIMNILNSGHPPFQQTPASPPNNNNLPQTFNYARPKQFITAQTLSPTESPVPMLNAMAQTSQRSMSEDNYAGSPITPTYPGQLFQTRVLQSPTSPTRFVSSPPPTTSVFSAFSIRPQSPAASPTPSSSTPSPIQNPVAFLSSVLPSLPTSQPTNAMGLPKRAPSVNPQGILKRNPRSPRSVSDDEIRDTKDTILHDLEKKLRFKEDNWHNGQRLTYEDKMARRLLGPQSHAAPVFNYDVVEECSRSQEYKVSSFEQRLMSEIEFRLERTPVEESDDEIEHDAIPTGKCIAPIFEKKLKHFRVMEGTPVSFTCKVVGIPVPKVYWFKDGKQISKKNTHYKMKREGDGTCFLHIAATTNDDDGNYTIMTANPQGRVSCTGHLIVQTAPMRSRLMPTIQSQRARSRVQEVDEGEPTQERFFRPHFLQAPGDLVAHEGRLCRLDCKVSGLPTPDLLWLMNGKPVLPDNTHKMLVRENGVHSLLIDPLMQSDAGTYTCIATNKAGQNSFCLELTVVAKEVKKAPVFLEKLQNTGIPEGTPVRLECRVVGMPPPKIFWKKDNDTISSAKERMSMHQDATGYVCLLIQPTRKEDAGWYTVSAKNEAGIVSCTARLDIYAQWHQQIPQPMKKVRSPSSRYAALTGQGLDILSAFPSVDSCSSLFSPSQEATVESEEL
ncbi:myopalladin-like isoform X2 [Acipenser ruthenus]|uniref:myopalladin-like isoform X2 n=1 Tax=Acipenser ruthenus TaxID=7906 RepID=UPI0027408F42|nr:myopalladin-like isoform X2 [Acipenser ruthenus]